MWHLFMVFVWFLTIGLSSDLACLHSTCTTTLAFNFTPGQATLHVRRKYMGRLVAWGGTTKNVWWHERELQKTNVR
jgi:hypothetical protein